MLNMCGVVLLTPVKRVLVLTVLVGCTFFVFRTISVVLRNVTVTFARSMESNSKRCSITPGQTTDENLYRRPPLRTYCFFLLLSLLFIHIVLLVYDGYYLHYLKPGPTLINASAFSFRFVLFYLIYFFSEENGPCSFEATVPIQARIQWHFQEKWRWSGISSPTSLISVAPEEKRNAKRILKQHLCFVKGLGERGSVKGEAFPPWKDRGPDELVAILCKQN